MVGRCSGVEFTPKEKAQDGFFVSLPDDEGPGEDLVICLRAESVSAEKKEKRAVTAKQLYALSAAQMIKAGLSPDQEPPPPATAIKGHIVESDQRCTYLVLRERESRPIGSRSRSRFSAQTFTMTTSASRIPPRHWMRRCSRTIG